MKRVRAVFLAMLAVLAVYWPIAALAGSAFISAVGTYQTTWQFGGTLGPMWNDNANALEAKDPTNTFFEVVRGAAPVSTNDLTTKTYTDTHPVLGDVTGTLAASVVSAISGTSPIAVAPATFQWAQGTLAPTFSQVQQANGSNPNSFTIAPQAPGAGASSTATGTPGSLVLSLGAPVSTGNEAAFVIKRAGTTVAALGGQPAGSPSVAELWLGPNAGAPTNANYAVQASSTITYLAASNEIAIGVGGNGMMNIFGTGNRGLGMPYPATLDAAGGDMVVTLNPAITVPNTALSNANNVTFYDNAGFFELFSKGLQWNALQSSPTIEQTQQANASNPNSLTIAPQAPGSGAASTATGTPGSLVVSLAAPVSTGNEGYFQVTRGGTTIASIGYDGGFGNLWLGNSAPTANNYTLWGDGVNAYINGTNLVVTRIGNTASTGITNNANGIQFFNEAPSLGGGIGVLGLANAGTNPTSNPSGGGVIYASGGGFNYLSSNGALTGFGASGFRNAPAAGISIAAGGTFTLSAAQYAAEYIVLTGSLAASATVVLPANAGSTWTVDATGVTLNAHTITLQANSVNWATTVGITNLYQVTYGGTGKLYGIALTP